MIYSYIFVVVVKFIRIFSEARSYIIILRRRKNSQSWMYGLVDSWSRISYKFLKQCCKIRTNSLGHEFVRMTMKSAENIRLEMTRRLRLQMTIKCRRADGFDYQRKFTDTNNGEKQLLEIGLQPSFERSKQNTGKLLVGGFDLVTVVPDASCNTILMTGSLLARTKERVPIPLLSILRK